MSEFVTVAKDVLQLGFPGAAAIAVIVLWRKLGQKEAECNECRDKAEARVQAVRDKMDGMMSKLFEEALRGDPK